MTALSITAANVAPSTGANIHHGTAGATITAGQAVYLDASDGLYKLADCDSATVAARSPAGIALTGSSSGQPIAVQVGGLINLGATLTPGTTYYLAPTAGGIGPLADVASGDTVTIMGIATSASLMKMGMLESGVTL